ncbi:MAG TPA: DUF2147 domain-containing protein [Pseudolabrys sp.]|nr:DUF2147 domain-containing protein [Pseudolabrys sp.]
MILILPVLCALASGGAAQQSAVPSPFDPTGEWLVAKRIAAIRVVNCDNQLWGVVSWEKAPGTDHNNPDPAQRNRPTLGMPVLIAMTQTKQTEWSGHIYNSNDGRTYAATISLANPNVLQVRGCVLGFLCGGEDWSRIPEKPPATTGARPRRGAPPPPPQPVDPWDPSINPVAQQPAEDICSGLLGGLPGSAHERRLK